MNLHVSPALETDAQRIAAIHMAAFGSNPMLLAQFPSPTVRQNLQLCIATKALADIRDPQIAVLVVRDSDEAEDEEIISFAKWDLPVLSKTETAHAETPWQWPEGTDWEVLERWSEVVESTKEAIVGGTPCYRK